MRRCGIVACPMWPYRMATNARKVFLPGPAVSPENPAAPQAEQKGRHEEQEGNAHGEQNGYLPLHAGYHRGVPEQGCQPPPPSFTQRDQPSADCGYGISNRQGFILQRERFRAPRIFIRSAAGESASRPNALRLTLATGPAMASPVPGEYFRGLIRGLGRSARRYPSNCKTFGAEYGGGSLRHRVGIRLVGLTIGVNQRRHLHLKVAPLISAGRRRGCESERAGRVRPDES